VFLRLKKWRETRTLGDLYELLRHPGMRPTWLIATLCLVAAGTVSWVADRAERTATAQSFDDATVRIIEEIENVMGGYQNLLRAGAGLFSADGDLQQAQWSAFIGTLDLQRHFPGVQGIGFARVIPSGSLAEHEADMRRRGRIGYTFYPIGKREIYTAIEFLEPPSQRNQRAIGFDMFSEPKRRAAMEQARDTRRPVMTRGVTLMQETSEDPQAGTLMYFPVFRAGPSAAWPGSEAPRELYGYVYTAFRMTNLFTKEMRVQLPALFDTVAVRIWDGAKVSKAMLLYQSHPELGRMEAARLYLERDLPIAGQNWRVEFAARPGFKTTTRWARPGLVLISGIVMSVLITAIAATLALARSQAVASQRELSAEVEARKAAQSEVQIANQELIHRVKNMMAVVTAIAGQTARYTPNPQEFNRVFRERLSALARVHDLLKTNPSYKPEISSLIGEILSPYTAGRETALVLGGPQVEISQQAAVMLSLVLNELATNAIKYGAWSRDSGRISISWSIETKDGVENVVMDWRETGGPKVEVPSRRGFGTNVLKFAIEQGLRGTFDPRFLDTGLECTWQFPRQALSKAPSDQRSRSY